MNAGTGILGYGGTVSNDSVDTVVGGALLLLVGLAILAVGGSRSSRLGAVGLLLWGACLVIPVVAGRA